VLGSPRRYNRYVRPFVRLHSMSSGPTPAPAWRGPASAPPAPPGPPWRVPPPRAPYRPRWRRLALAAALGLLAVAVVTWVVFWIRPPAPARIVILRADYDNTLAVAPNPYGKADAREIAALARPGSWFGTRSRLAGGPITTFTRTGLPDLSTVREKCVVVFIAAHGGRDRDGPFLFPEDSTGEPADRVRFKTLLDQLARLPAHKQKLLIIDATHEPAFTELGLVHNDFAAGVEEIDAEIAAVPNLAVFLSSGTDERSWTSPEWGTSAFMHYAMAGLNGSADADGNQRVTAGELVSYVTPRVSDWARDNRGARQVPVLLPKSDGTNRVRGMHLVSVDAQPQATMSAPEPFIPPPELKTQWQEYRELASETPPPTAYTPHLWRQYETWVLRHEQQILANDVDGAKVARANAAEVRRKIAAARTLDISPQTIAIQSAVGGQPYTAMVPETFKIGIESLAREPAASRAKLWANLRVANGDSDISRLRWCRALIEWVAVDPVERLPISRSLIPLVGDGLAIRPAELNFLSMLARHLPASDKKEIVGPLLTRVLRTRLHAEQTAGMLVPADLRDPPPNYPFAELLYPWIKDELAKADVDRRIAEDLCFATDESDWKRADTLAKSTPADYQLAAKRAEDGRTVITSWHHGADRLTGSAEWVARSFTNPADRKFAFRLDAWANAHRTAVLIEPSEVFPADVWLKDQIESGNELTEELCSEACVFATEIANLLKVQREFDASPTSRAAAVKWWNTADALLTAPPTQNFDPAQRVVLAREFRRVSRQLLITSETRPEPLPEVTSGKSREIAFETARRRGEMLLGRFGGLIHIRELGAVRPGEDWKALQDRLTWFAFRADGRQSLAIFGSRCGELFDAAVTLARNPDGYREADRWVRISPAHAPISDEPIDRMRRERVRGYLVFQATRTFADHWYGEGDTCYYQLAIQRLKGDATSLVAAFPPADDPFQSLLEKEKLFPVVPELPMRIAITDEPKPTVRLPFTANPIPNVEGVSVFWIDPKARTPICTIPGCAVLSHNLTRPAPPQPLTPKAQSENLAVAGFFRGRSFNASTPVDFYAVPDSTAVNVPLPQTVSIAVRADVRATKLYGYGTGAIAIVLDCSGSMGRNPKDPFSVGYYPEAVDALAKLLNELPRGTIVTVWTFGQRMPDAKSPEETIHELLQPRELPLKKDEFEDLLQRARGQEPWYESPVVRSAVIAKNSIIAKKVPFKAVVLLSDCVDNRFAVDPDFGGKKLTISDVLRAEFPPEVAFGVVAFPVSKEEQAVQGEFKIVEKLMPAGKFVSPKEVDRLIDWLRTGLNPRVRYTLQPLTSDTPAPGGLMAGTIEHDNWYSGRLAPGDYRLQVEGDAKLTSDVHLSAGDRLLLDLTENLGALKLQRHWFANTVPAVTKVGELEGEWRMALLQNRAKDGRVELFTAIDANPNKLDRLRPTRIRDVWFEVTPSIPKPEPVAIRWHSVGGFPAPCWSFDSPGWPNFPGSAAPASPQVRAWWAPKPFPAAVELLAASGDPLGLRGSLPKVNGNIVTLDAVDLEEHEVEVLPGQRQKRMCLVVRLTHAKDAPVFVRPMGVTPTSGEVRLYKTANKATCLFWWPELDAASVNATVRGFAFVPLNEALRAAEKAGRYLILTAPAPTDTSARPEPPTK